MLGAAGGRATWKTCSRWSRCPVRLRAVRNALLDAPRYRPLGQANARDTGGAEGWGRRGREPRDPNAYTGERHDDRRAPRSPPRYEGRGHHYQQVVQGRHAGTVQRDQREEAEAVRSRQRAMERLSRLEREMAELRRELEEPPRPERGNHD
ncbi:hypothetical protein L917_05610 [Phytophthora nicotianae]|uniref:Uncharacterized protein n=1 Tax=Phytophthora nicotianae TaxID=4792 RepID=W2LK63_PHYNI|nr:hypothetical protein L916_05724 [Phytophthora nicotianae]ETL97025.1 hypothetical protein L917_05610 [Phytophthora nicotianae]